MFSVLICEMDGIILFVFYLAPWLQGPNKIYYRSECFVLNVTHVVFPTLSDHSPLGPLSLLCGREPGKGWGVIMIPTLSQVQLCLSHTYYNLYTPPCT